MADTATQFSTLSTDAPNVWIARETYRLAERNLRIGKYAKRYTLPQRFGKTLRIVRHKRLNLPTATLTEGTPPDAVALAIENVDVTVEQWGIVVLLTDVAQITTEHPALQVAVDRTALAMAEVLEREMAVMLMAGTTIFYPSAASRDLIGASEKIDTATVLKATVSLRNQGAGEGEGGLYSGVMSPQMEADVLSTDQSFKDASNFANVRALQFGEIGIWMGVRWARSNFLPIYKGVAAPTTAATTATKSQIGTAAGSTGTWAGANQYFAVVARDKTTDFERLVSPASASAGATSTQYVPIITPTSTNYVYDIYSGDTATTLKLFASRVAATTTTNVTGPGTGGAPPTAPANTREVFVAWVFGQDAFGRVELNGMSLQSYVTPPGASYSNPLAQGRKVGSKIMWKSFIIDNTYFARIEAASGYSAQLPA